MGYPAGYFVYAEAEETLVLDGAPLSSETIFSLEAGWNLVPFVLQDPMDAEEAFAGIADNLLMAKDDEGQTFIPSLTSTPLAPSAPAGRTSCL